MMDVEVQEEKKLQEMMGRPRADGRWLFMLIQRKVQHSQHHGGPVGTPQFLVFLYPLHYSSVGIINIVEARKGGRKSARSIKISVFPCPQ